MQNKLDNVIHNAQDNVPPEFYFLITCCKTHLTKDDIALILSYLNTMQHSDLNTLISLATQHGILPVFYKTLKKLLQSDSTLSIKYNTLLEDLKFIYTQIAQQNMLMSAELIRIMKLLEENGIKSLSFKGPTLSQMVYGDITLRQYSDLDILIKEEDRDKISRLLESQGYEQVLVLTPVQEKNWYKHAKDMSLFHSQKGLYIELHWLLLDNDHPIQVDLDNIWTDSQMILINGQRVQTFSTESLLHYLCIHGSKHLWERLEWIKDIDLIIRTQLINWVSMNKQINNNGSHRMVLLGLYLSHTLFQTPLPTIIKQQIHNQNWLIKLSDFVINDWKQHRSMFHNSIAMLYLFPTIKMKLLYLHKVILKPSKNEYRFVDFPKKLYWMYYFVRPYLLIKKYLTKN